MPAKSENTTSLAEAKAHFAECVRRVEQGQTVLLTRHGRPVARLVPLRPDSPPDWNLDRDLDIIPSEVGEGQAKYETSRTASPSDLRGRRAALQRLLEDEVWPQIPEKVIGKAPTKKEREDILGIDEDNT